MKNKTAYQTSLDPNPSDDGIAHINTHYNFATTQLGRQLSSYYVAPFLHPYFGPFKCVEGFMLFVKTGCVDGAFRTMSGAKAKLHYKAQSVKQKTPVLYDHILLLANYAKIASNAGLAKALKESTLPFDYYYLFGPGKIPVRPTDWQLDVAVLTQVRQLLQTNCVPDPLPDDDYAALIAS